jgi:hypothetical protein
VRAFSTEHTEVTESTEKKEERINHRFTQIAPDDSGVQI